MQDWTGVNDSLKKVIEMQNRSQQAKMNLQTKLLLSKLESTQEFRNKQAMIPLEVESERQKKQIMTPLEQEELNRYKASPDSYDIVGGKPKRLGLKDMAERVYQKPQESWTDSDRTIVNQYRSMTKGDKMSEEAEKPLSGDSSVRYASALRAIDMTRNINTELLSNISPEDIKDKKDMVYKANSYINGVTATDTIVPGAKGWYTRGMREKAGDKGAKIGNYFLNLAESLLRAESGAAVTDSEMLRAKARSLFDAFVQSPDTWKSTLQTNLDFAKNIAREIRPSRESEWGYNITDAPSAPPTFTGVPEGRTIVQDANGNQFHLLVEQLAEALQSGYKKVGE